MSTPLRNINRASKQVYDYIIVGGGSAGCVMANRLSQDPNVSVALLETGPDDKTPIVQNPSGFFWGVPFSRKYNHRFWSTPQKELNNRKTYQPRGKVIGGSSSINAMIYIRGLKYDYDRWAAEANCEGWNYDSLLPLFKAHENHDTIKHDPYHGNEGELGVRTAKDKPEICESFIKAANHRGLPTTNDFNGEDQTGVGYYNYTQNPGRRNNTGNAFLTPEVRARSNLHIITEAQATKVIMEQKTAKGVQVVPAGQSKVENSVEFSAKKDVILCGGAFNSPHLLMLSGIGPKEELEKHGIDVVHNLPGVGQNLQDHADIIVNAKYTKGQSHVLQIAVGNIFKILNHAYRLVFKNTGAYSGDFGFLGAFYKSRPEIPGNDIQMHVAPLVYKDHGAKLGYGKGFSMASCYLRPESRGRVGLKSANPLDHPLIDPNYFGNKNDWAPMIASLRKCIDFVNSPSLQEMGAKITCFKEDATDVELKEFLRKETETIYHPTSTCTMGPASNSMAVVDHSNGLKVHGVNNLRVIDASIMPFLISGNTNAPTMVVAQKAYNQMIGADFSVKDLSASPNNTFQKPRKLKEEQDLQEAY